MIESLKCVAQLVNFKIHLINYHQCANRHGIIWIPNRFMNNNLWSRSELSVCMKHENQIHNKFYVHIMKFDSKAAADRTAGETSILF